jgi:hypothetical protein
MRRRAIRAICGLVAVGLFSVISPVEAAGRDGRPNIVFVLSDNQRWDFMGCSGHPFVRTPHLDPLYREGPGVRGGPRQAGGSDDPEHRPGAKPARDGRVPSSHAVRTKQHVYIEFEGRRGCELYDLQEDPRQRINLIHTDEGREIARGLKAMLEDLKGGREG